jgi:hypothetical protein
VSCCTMWCEAQLVYVAPAGSKQETEAHLVYLLWGQQQRRGHAASLHGARRAAGRQQQCVLRSVAPLFEHASLL